MNNSGFVHCDLKLENILVQYDDKLTNSFPIMKIIDFGSTFESAKGLPKIVILLINVDYYSRIHASIAIVAI